MVKKSNQVSQQKHRLIFVSLLCGRVVDICHLFCGRQQFGLALVWSEGEDGMAKGNGLEHAMWKIAVFSSSQVVIWRRY